MTGREGDYSVNPLAGRPAESIKSKLYLAFIGHQHLFDHRLKQVFLSNLASSRSSVLPQAKGPVRFCDLVCADNRRNPSPAMIL